MVYPDAPRPACPKCNSHDVVVDDMYDVDHEDTHCICYYVGHCEKCATELQWQNVFNFYRTKSVSVC